MLTPKMIGVIVAGLAVSLFLWRVTAWRAAYRELPAVKAQAVAAEKARLDQIEQSRKDTAKSAEQSEELAKLRGKEAEIQTKIVTVNRKELVYVKVPGECPVRSEPYRLLYNEAVTGTSPPPAQ